MTWSIFIGNNMVFDYSSSTADIGNLVKKELDKKRQTQYPLFHRLFDQDKTISWKDARALYEELCDIETGLLLVRIPVAAMYKGDCEINYHSGDSNNGKLCQDRTGNQGVDKQGLYIQPIKKGIHLEHPSLFPQESELGARKYFQELKKGQPYFLSFGESLPYFAYTNPDRITHTFKSGNQVWKTTLNKLEDIAKRAEDERKNIHT